IVGGGPAGLSAALMLGRCRRRVLLCDTGGQRNIRARHLHLYPTRDGATPSEYLRLARAELGRYGTIECRELEIVEASKEGRGFVLLAADGARFETRKLLLATGIVDELPELEGLDELYGTSVHHCPYCDAWEWRDRPLAAHGSPDQGPGLALSLTAWSDDVLLCTGGAAVSPDASTRLRAAGIEVREERILRLEGSQGRLHRIVFAGGDASSRSALFVCHGQRQRSPLAERLGCRFTEGAAVDTGKCEATNVSGLYVAGDASKEAQLVVLASAEGAEAGMSIHRALMEEDQAHRARVSGLTSARRRR
ncbi:MAG: NAD(P)/FAD-dependent oxidoreductase, partial [Gemmatimonadales bacterium]|nr:NAD(P)/FAD-dependent oxidoreductase [Gemmatimonadales bacterium]